MDNNSNDIANRLRNFYQTTITIPETYIAPKLISSKKEKKPSEEQSPPPKKEKK